MREGAWFDGEGPDGRLCLPRVKVTRFSMARGSADFRGHAEAPVELRTEKVLAWRNRLFDRCGASPYFVAGIAEGISLVAIDNGGVPRTAAIVSPMNT